MREKYILRSGNVGAEPDAWIVGVCFTRSKVHRSRGVLTIGGPSRFREDMDEVLSRYFGVADGVENECAQERQPEKRRKRLVYDVGPMKFKAFHKGVREMVQVGISAAKVTSTGRLLR